MFNFAQNDIVAFTVGDLKGYGKIVGCSTIELPVLGRMYIVEVITSTQPLPSDTYPFTTIAVPEIHLDKVKTKGYR